MIAIIDYGVGNLFSLSASLKYLNIQSVITNDYHIISSCDKIILPGVGAFGNAMEKLKNTQLIPFLNEQVTNGKPILGICLGMQLLFEKSYEYGIHEGLKYLKGDIVPLSNDLPENITIPHMGWNSLRFIKPNKLLKYINEGEFVYYVHSFYAKNCEESLVASSCYGVSIPGIVSNNNVYGTQFHPEKSGKTGLNILKAFSEI
ncbi:imidazole glycerol phosphate synthase subunit HisH [Eubacteriales bacterium OttesenSCG-928-G02]|nr:imidazole glycerol phosphate synthase subunit HisH [Eubacteriales bacterium OttesenSCG-928-G02]